MRSASSFIALACLGLTACSGTDDANGGGDTTGTGGTFASGGGTSDGSGGFGNDNGNGTGGTFTGTGGFTATGGSSNTGGSDGDGDPVQNDCGLPELSSPLAPASSALEVVNWAGKQAAISYTFDDGTATQVSNYTTLNNLGVPFTFYLVTNWSGTTNNINLWKQAILDGHEIGNHSHTHPQAGTGSELDNATNYIQTNLGVKPLTMAAPYGDTSYKSHAQTRFLFNRGVNGGSIAPNGNVDRYDLPTFIPATGADKNALDAGVNTAVNQGRWQIVLIHGFTGANDSPYQPVPLDAFLQHVQGQRDSGKVWIDTLLNVGAYYLAQKLLNETQPIMSGEGSTWSWTLPQFFPEGRCLRIRSNGRVLQNGQPVAEHPNGYYDISLDVGSVTVAPM